MHTVAGAKPDSGFVQWRCVRPNARLLSRPHCCPRALERPAADSSLLRRLTHRAANAPRCRWRRAVKGPVSRQTRGVRRRRGGQTAIRPFRQPRRKQPTTARRDAEESCAAVAQRFTELSAAELSSPELSSPVLEPPPTSTTRRLGRLCRRTCRQGSRFDSSWRDPRAASPTGYTEPSERQQAAGGGAAADRGGGGAARGGGGGIPRGGGEGGGRSHAVRVAQGASCPFCSPPALPPCRLAPRDATTRRSLPPCPLCASGPTLAAALAAATLPAHELLQPLWLRQQSHVL